MAIQHTYLQFHNHGWCRTERKTRGPQVRQWCEVRGRRRLTLPNHRRTAMHAAILLGIALTGLGCQNKSSDLSEVPPVYTSIGTPGTNPYPSYAAPSSYSGYYQRSYGEDVSDVYPTHWDAMRANNLQLRAGARSRREHRSGDRGFRLRQLDPAASGPKPPAGRHVE